MNPITMTNLMPLVARITPMPTQGPAVQTGAQAAVNPFLLGPTSVVSSEKLGLLIVRPELGRRTEIRSIAATQRDAVRGILRLWQATREVRRDFQISIRSSAVHAAQKKSRVLNASKIVQVASLEEQLTMTAPQSFRVLSQPLPAVKLKQEVSRFGACPIQDREGPKEQQIVYEERDVSTTEHQRIWNDPLAIVTATLPVTTAFGQFYFIMPSEDSNSVHTDLQAVRPEHGRRMNGRIVSGGDAEYRNLRPSTSLRTNEITPVHPEPPDKLGTQPGRKVNDKTLVSAKKIIDATTSPVKATSVSRSGITRDGERIIEALKKVLGSSAELNVRRARNNSNKDRGDRIIVDTAIAGVPVELCFIRDGGGYIFGGWQDQLPSSQALVSGVERGTLAETYQDGRTPVLGLGRAGGEPHSSPQTIEARIEMQFVSLVMSQFSMEPSAQNIGRTLDAFNSVILRYSFPGFEKKITLEEWTGYLREALKAAYSSSPAINEGGIRSNRAIQADAAHILNIKRPLLTGWEAFLKAEDTTAKLLAGDKMPQKGADSGAQKRLLEALDKHMVGRAQGILDFPTNEFTFGIGRELKLEWQAARISAVKDSAEKIDRTVRQIEAFLSKDEIKLAGRFLALIFMNSDVNELPSAKDPIAPRWSESEVRSLLKVLCSNGTSAVVGHRWFRQYLSVRENRMVNLAIQGIDTEMTFSNIAQLNIDEASDAEFWAAVDNEPNLLNTAIARMAEMVH